MKNFDLLQKPLYEMLSHVKGNDKAVNDFRFSIFNTCSSITSLTGDNANPANPHKLSGDPAALRQQQIAALCDTLTTAQTNADLIIDEKTRAEIDSLLIQMKP